MAKIKVTSPGVRRMALGISEAIELTRQIYRSAGPPEHFACPACFEKDAIHILQDKKTMSGNYACPNCKGEFHVNVAQPWPSMPPRGWQG
jgi:predicted RNA-binding Zn-ribbon protein involved in translation (DUF1610 family)